MNGATGTSTAYVFNIGDTKLVFLAISFKATDLVKKGGGNIGKLPDSLKPTDGIRIAATQDAVIANENGWGDLSNLLLWCNAQNQNPTNAISGSVTYVASN